VLLGVLVAEYTPYVHTDFALFVRAGYAGSHVHSVHMLVQGAGSVMLSKVFLRHMAQVTAHGIIPLHSAVHAALLMRLTDSESFRLRRVETRL